MEEFVSFIKEFANNQDIRAEYCGTSFSKSHCDREDSFVISSHTRQVTKRLYAIEIVYREVKIINIFYITELPLYLKYYTENNFIHKSSSNDFDHLVFESRYELEMDIFYRSRQKSANK